MMPPLQFIDAGKRWNGKTALNGLDLSLAPGEVVALLGRAEAGKTTAVGLALGLYTPCRGSVRLFGATPGRMAVRRRIGVMMQRADLPGTARVDEMIRLVRAYYPAPMSLEQAGAAAGIQHLFNRRIGRLSAAQRRCVQVALALCGRPDILVLDDPCAGMDAAAREQLRAGIRDLARDGCAVLTTSQYADELEGLADRVCVLSGGTVVAQSTLAEWRAQHVVRRVVCRTTASVHRLYDLPEALLVQTQPDGRLSIETGTPELLVQRLFTLDPCLSELQVLHAKTPHALRIG